MKRANKIEPLPREIQQYWLDILAELQTRYLGLDKQGMELRFKLIEKGDNLSNKEGKRNGSRKEAEGVYTGAWKKDDAYGKKDRTKI